jgi:hypothetical protein
MRTSLALAAAGLLLIATPALAAARDTRPARDGSTAPAPTPVPAPPPAGGASTHSSGSIHSVTTVSTNSGGNSGSYVTTGDQSSTVTVINIGPTDGASGTVIIPPAQQQDPAPQCTGRMCPRTR